MLMFEQVFTTYLQKQDFVPLDLLLSYCHISLMRSSRILVRITQLHVIERCFVSFHLFAYLVLHCVALSGLSGSWCSLQGLRHGNIIRCKGIPLKDCFKNCQLLCSQEKQGTSYRTKGWQLQFWILFPNNQCSKNPPFFPQLEILPNVN